MKTEPTIEEQVDLAIAKIAVLCNQINRKTEICAFFKDNAHVSKIEVSVRQSKKHYEGTPAEFEINYNAEGSPFNSKDDKYTLKRCNECIESLEAILTDKKVDFSMFEAVREYVIARYEI